LHAGQLSSRAPEILHEESAEMKIKKFKAELLLGHKGAAVEVPFDPAKLWAISARPLWPGRRGRSVRGEVNGVSFESCIVPRSRKFWMLVDEEVQKKAGVSVGDTVRVSVEPLFDSDDPS
jgi:hypothetical protein